MGLRRLVPVVLLLAGADPGVCFDFLDPLFKDFYERIGLRQLLFKRNCHALADLIDPARLDCAMRSEIEEKLDAIISVSRSARAPAAGMVEHHATIPHGAISGYW